MTIFASVRSLTYNLGSFWPTYDFKFLNRKYRKIVKFVRDRRIMTIVRFSRRSWNWRSFIHSKYYFCSISASWTFIFRTRRRVFRKSADFKLSRLVLIILSVTDLDHLNTMVFIFNPPSFSIQSIQKTPSKRPEPAS